MIPKKVWLSTARKLNFNEEQNEEAVNVIMKGGTILK